MKKIFTLIIFAVMALTNVVAQNVAKIGETEYATLRDAVSKSNSSTSPVTITLLGDVTDVITESIEFMNSNVLVTLDLNGHNVNLTKGNAIVTGKLELVNNETVKSEFSTGTKMTLIYVKGSGVLDIKATNMRLYSANRTIYVDPQATLNIDGGQTEPGKLGYNQIESREAACVENHGTSTVNNVKMLSTGKDGRCFLAQKGTLDITNVWALTTYFNVLKLENGSGDVTVNNSYFECQNYSGTIRNCAKNATLKLNNVQCYNKNVSGWNYNHADHRAIKGDAGTKIVINGGKYWSDINQAILTDGELIATDMEITTRPLKGSATAKFTLKNCKITVGNFTAIDVTASTPVQIDGGTYQSSSHIMTVPTISDGVTIKNATLKSTSASATLLVCNNGANLTLDKCEFSTAGTALQLAENNTVTVKDCKVKAQTPFSVPDPEEGETFEDLNINVSVENTLFSAEPDAQVIAGFVSSRNTDPETASEYPYIILSYADSFDAYKAGAAAYARGLKNGTGVDDTLENIAQQIEAMTYDATKSYAEQIAAIENLLGNIEGLYVAAIGDTKYLSLRAAIEAANNSAEDVTIQLVNSFADEIASEINVNNTNGKAITLDLNGKSFTCKQKGFGIYSVFNVLNSSTTKSTATIAGVSGASLFWATESGVLNLNGKNCSFVGSNSNNRIVFTYINGIATVDGGSYSAKHNCFLGSSNGKLTIKNLSATTSGECTIAISKGTAEIENVTSVVTSRHNALYLLDGAGDVYAKNCTFKSAYNASVVKVYSPASVTLTLDNCEVNNSTNLANPSPSDSNHAMYINTSAHVVIKNSSYIHSLTNRPVRSLGSVEAENSTFYGYYGFLVENANAKAKLTNCKMSAKHNGALEVNKNCSPNNETSITGGTYSATYDYVFRIDVGNKIKIDGITMSGTGYGLYTAGDVTVSNSTLGGSISAVRIINNGKVTLQDCKLSAPTPLVRADETKHSVKCEGTVIANNIIDEEMLVGMVCGANDDPNTNTQYPYVAKLGTVAFDEYRTIVKTYINGYKAQYSAQALMTVIDQQVAALDAMTYNSGVIFANQAAAMLDKAKIVACALIDIIHGGETDQTVVDMVTLVKGNINDATDTSLLDAAKNDGVNAIINARRVVVEPAKEAAKEAIDEAVNGNTDPAVVAAANTAKQAIDAAQTTAEVETAKENGLTAIKEAIATGMVGVDTENAAAIYNLNGTRLSSASSTGIYIIGNKKVAVRK